MTSVGLHPWLVIWVLAAQLSDTIVDFSEVSPCPLPIVFFASCSPFKNTVPPDKSSGCLRLDAVLLRESSRRRQASGRIF